MIELLTSAAVLISSMYGPASTTPASAVASSTPASTTIAVDISTTTAFADNTGVMAYVKAQYTGEPILVDIARCESAFRQYDSKTGDVLHGVQNKQDIGVMQINIQYQGAKAASMGYDINTVEGNVAYAKYLYDSQGAVPWDASATCWSKAYTASIMSTNINAVAVK